MRKLVAVVIALIAVRSALAQELRGTVRDSTSRQPISNAVLLLLDSAGKTVGRNLTNDRGLYRIALSPEIARMRVLRLGFRPREVRIPPTAVGDVRQLDVSMVALPSLLEPVRVTGNANCPRRRDEVATFALLEQARTGLLAVMVAREANPGRLSLLQFQRRMEETSDRIRHQRVWADSVRRSAVTFVAVRTPAEFITQGFVQDSAGISHYLGPDADVLLDDAFANAYCFRLADADRNRPHEVGLAFGPAQRRSPRIDIDGTLWVDTIARTIVRIEYRYVGFPIAIDRWHPGGHIAFRTMPNGVTLIDEWAIRMVSADADSTSDRRGGIVVRQWPYYWDGGGELAHAVWPDGQRWDATLGTLRVRAKTHAGQPAANVTVHLDDTHYRTVSDAAGNFEIVDLLPGPYALMVDDPRLSEIRLPLATSVTFTAARDSVVQHVLDVPTPDDTTVTRCLADGRYARNDSVRVLGRVLAFDDRPIGDVEIRIADATKAHGLTPDRPQVLAAYHTGTDGLFQFCVPQLALDMDVLISATRGKARSQVVRKLSEQLTIVRVPLDP